MTTTDRFDPELVEEIAEGIVEEMRPVAIPVLSVNCTDEETR